MKRTLFAMGIALASLASQAGDLQVSVIDKEGKPVQDAVVVLVPSTKASPKTALPTQIT
ncbi:MAG: plastocyanin, partial [Variovorax sp.]